MRPLDFECLTCDAAAGDLCREWVRSQSSATRAFCTYYHASRVDAAFAAMSDIVELVRRDASRALLGPRP